MRRPSAQSSRTPNNKTGFHVVLMSFSGLSINERGQRAKCFFGHLGARQSNGSQSRLSELTQVNIVKANQGNVFGDPQFRVVYGAQRSDGSQVIGCQDGCGWFRKREQAFHRYFASVNFMVPYLDQGLILEQSKVSERFEEGCTPSKRRAQCQWTADETNSLVPQLNQVRHCCTNAFPIVHSDIADAGAGFAS